MAVPHTAWPTGADIIAALAALPQPITVPAGYDMDSVAAAAITEWDRMTGYRPFFQTDAIPVAVPFNPPGPNSTGYYRGGSTRLQVANGLISLTSLFAGVDAANGDNGTQLLTGKDFYLAPSDAPSKGEPYTCIEFNFAQRGLPQSIIVTGIWGYCQTHVPNDAWLGVLRLGQYLFAEDMLASIFASPTSIKVLSDEITQDSFRELGLAWQQQAQRAKRSYRLITGGNSAP